MIKKEQRRPLVIVAAAAFGLLLMMAAPSTIEAGQTADELLAKKYAKILGKYAIELEGQTMILEFAVRQGGLWTDSGDGRPAEIKPVGDSLSEFTAQDEVNGLFQFKFQKDEAGNYTECRVICSFLGMDVIAVRIKES